MLNETAVKLGKTRSTIREIFEYGNKRAAQVGRENIFDFSIGNPNVPAPDAVQDVISELIKTEDIAKLHGYTSAQGAPENRKAIADELNKRFGTNYNENQLYLTVGAAASLTISLNALTSSKDDEFIVFAPYFPEYLVFIEQGAGAKAVVIPPREQDFQIDFDTFISKINENTKGVIINSPSNPSGVVYTNETIKKLAEILKDKSKEYNHPIYLLSDEPYREIVYDVEVPFVAKEYDRTIVCYSYSKSLSLAGERIGYILVPNVEEFDEIYAAVCGAGRMLGFVNAPSLFQKVIAKCTGMTSDLSIYAENRRLLLEGFEKMGYSCVKPDGAFYMFPKSLEPDDRAFCERAKKYDLLLVPGSDFGAKGHVRISYCVKTETIKRALPLFEKLAEEYRK